jgi:hypothetical protein
METFEKISELGWPKTTAVLSLRERTFVFRVTFCVVVRGENEVRSCSFVYEDFVSARRGYRDVLLRLYKSRRVFAGFAICLNRFASPEWVGAIFSEGDLEAGFAELGFAPALLGAARGG